MHAAYNASFERNNSFMSKLEDLYKSFVIGDIKNTELEPDVDAWYAFLDALKKPADVFEEAYNKYLCRMYYFKRGKAAVLNVISFLVLIPLTIRMLSHKSNFPKIDKDLLLLEEQSDVSYKDIFPYELKDIYREFKIVKREKGTLGNLGDEAKQLYLRTWKKYWAHPYFLMWIMKELSNHSNYIEKYNPKALAFYINERNVASPILTKLYEDRGGKLISFMHGEYLLQLIQAYFAVSEYYIWRKEYSEMFKVDLRCPIGNLIVYQPDKLTKKWKLEKVVPDFDITYYFSGESLESIKKIYEVFKKLCSRGMKCKVRPHPRYSHLDVIKDTFVDIPIENPKATLMEESLANTLYAAGLATTVLSEAFIEGREIVIDNVSNPNLYNNLSARKYAVLSLKHHLLSDFLED